MTTKQLYGEVKMKLSELEHGAIYQMIDGSLARCNICYQGTEVWFTNKKGKQSGHHTRIVRKVKDKDESFKHNDIQDYDH